MKKKSLNEFYDDMPVNKDLFDYEALTAPPLQSLIPAEVDNEMYRIATSISLSGNLKEKYKLMDELMAKYDFTMLARGTNRSVYACNYNPDIVVKVGYDRSGITDAANEFKNQTFLKPFCSKCFDVSRSGAIGLFERVIPIKHQEEFASIAEDVFDMLTQHILGRYILQDIGSDYYMNYGIRDNFGPVLLDYPYLFELDGKKLKCNNLDTRIGLQCDGHIDYDDGFNHLVCDKCGKIYDARELALERIKEDTLNHIYTGIGKGDRKMKLTSNGKTIFDSKKGGALDSQQQPKVDPKKEVVESSEVVVVHKKPEPQVEVLTGYQQPEQQTQQIFNTDNNTSNFMSNCQDLLEEAYRRGMIDGKHIAEDQIRQRKQPQQQPQQAVEIKPRTIEELDLKQTQPYRNYTPKKETANDSYISRGFGRSFDGKPFDNKNEQTRTSRPLSKNRGFYHAKKDFGLKVDVKPEKKPVIKQEPKQDNQPKKQQMTTAEYNSKLTRTVSSAVLDICLDWNETDDSMIFGIIYGILNYCKITESDYFKFDRDETLQIAEKITDFVEKEMEDKGYTIDRSNQENETEDELKLEEPADGNLKLEPISDETDANSYAAKTKDIDFPENFNEPPKKDQATIETENLFKQALDSISNPTADPNDTSVSEELQKKINEQLNKQ